MMMYFGAILAIASNLTWEIPSPSSSSEPLPLSSSYWLAQSDYANELLWLTNKARQEEGLPPLRLSPQLSQAAQEHAEDIMKNQLSDHQGSDGSSPSDRARAAGYTSDYIGENIAAGRLTATATIEGWLNEPHHRANLLNPNYTDVGFGYVNAPESQYQHYWVQVFGTSSPNSREPSTTKPPSINASSDCQGQKVLSAATCVGDELSQEEEKLARLINQYRTQYQLLPIPLSSSLSRVANRHLRDLQDNASLYDRSGKDWRFGWSNCAYDANQATTFACLWAAPQRVKTAYPGRGYEIICGGTGQIVAEDALSCWQKSPLNDDLLLNQGLWLNYQWQALGIGIDRGYAVLWFGQEVDGVRSPRPWTETSPQPRRGRVW